LNVGGGCEIPPIKKRPNKTSVTAMLTDIASKPSQDSSRAA
jgi:hypothetical protein